MGNLLTKNDMILVGLIFAAMAFFIVAIKLCTRKRKRDPKKEQKQIKTLERVYGILLSNKLTRNYMIRAAKKYGSLSVFSQTEIKCQIVKDFRITVFGTVIIMVGSAFAFREFSAIILCLYGAFTIFNVRADKEIEKATVKVYKEVKIFISSLRIEFKKSNGDILLALEGATCGRHIMRAVDEIKQILVSPYTEEHIEKFYQNTPFKQLQTLAMVCSNIYTHGDVSVGSDSSVFDESMLLMEADINQKLEEISYEKILYRLQMPIFNSLEWLAALGVVLTILLKFLMIKIMPSTESVYNSIAGFLIQDAAIAYSIYSYNTVARAHLQQVILPDDRMSIVSKLMKRKPVQKFMRAMSPKEQKRRILEYKLKISVSKHTVDSYWCERCVFATVAFLGILMLTFTAPVIEKQFLETYTKSFDLMADNKAYQDKNGKVLYTDDLILEMDNAYIGIRKEGQWEAKDEEDNEEIRKFLIGYMPTLTTLHTEEQKERLETKYQKLNNVSYHWWYSLIAIAVGVAGFYYPKKKLKARLELAQFEEEEEFLQLQMITLILSSLNMDTFDTLGHLANIADFHKKELTQCYYGYASDPEKELQTLEDSVQSPNFKLFVGKLKETVENLSVKEVFADLRNDRVHICNERDNFIKSNISHKRAKMGRMALMPMNLAIYGVMVFPLLYSGITGLTGMTKSLQEM
jgi:hypothetical protein